MVLVTKRFAGAARKRGAPALLVYVFCESNQVVFSFGPSSTKGARRAQSLFVYIPERNNK